MQSLTRAEWGFLAALFLFSFVPSVAGLVRVGEFLGGPALAPPNPRAIAAPAPIILHILASSIFCLAGALQFLPSLRRSRQTLHRRIGGMVMLAGVASAASGLWMTHVYSFPEALQGAALYWVRVAVGLAMLALIARAIAKIRVRNVPGHAAAMIRAYALGQGASTQAFLGMGWMIAAGTEPLGPLRDVLMISGWVLNLIVAEILIARIWASQPRQPARASA